MSQPPAMPDPSAKLGAASISGATSMDGGMAVDGGAVVEGGAAVDVPPPGGWFRLRVLPAAWMRASMTTVTALLTIVVALGDLASAWVVLVLPAAVAVGVAYHEALERLLRPNGGPAHETTHLDAAIPR